MDGVRLTISCYPEISDYGYAAELHVEDLNAPLPAARTTCLRELFDRLTVPNGRPVTLSECCSYLAGAGIRNRVLEIGDLQESFAYFVYLPSDNSIKPNGSAVCRRRCETDQVICAWGDVVMPDLIYVEGKNPMQAWADIPLVLAETTKDACLKWLENHKRNQRLEEPLNDFEDPVEHARLLRAARWMLEGCF